MTQDFSEVSTSRKPQKASSLNRSAASSLWQHSNFRYLDQLSPRERIATVADSDLGIGVFSEVGRLRKVLVHSPGPEVELMTPKTASELLYNDIIHYRHVRDAHAELKAVLQLGAEVLEVKDCLAQVLRVEVAKSELLTSLTASQGCTQLYQPLMDLDAAELANALVAGVPLKRDTLETYLTSKSFSVVPLPNMYFMRDSSMVIGNKMVASAMASKVRLAEALIMRSIFEFHPSLRGAGVLLDACGRKAADDFTIEGGDVLVINENVLLIGISERTTPKAVDALINALHESRKLEENTEPFNVLCVLLPAERSTIHLDMIFTCIGTEQALVYAPYILGRERSRVVRVRVNARGEKKFSDVDDLLLGLRSVGVRMDPVLCGGDSLLHQQREQWNSGANMFAIAPGKIISYDMHEHTVASLRAAGFRVVPAKELIAQPNLLEASAPLVITVAGTELARGGGGPRCMTCPVLRDKA